MSLSKINELIVFFSSTKKQLLLFAHGKNNINTEIYKKVFIYSKSGKKREINIPTLKLKVIQKKILHGILGPYWESSVQDEIKEISTGFCKGKSIIDNASPHIGKKLIIKIDLQNFFPSISQNRVFGLYHKILGFNVETSSILSGLCTYNNQLPQGAPTSPLISNLICHNLGYKNYSLFREDF